MVGSSHCALTPAADIGDSQPSRATLRLVRRYYHDAMYIAGIFQIITLATDRSVHITGGGGDEPLQGSHLAVRARAVRFPI